MSSHRSVLGLRRTVTVGLALAGVAAPAGVSAGAPAWQVVPSPNPGSGTGELYGLAVAAPDDVWAVGRYTTPQGYRTLAMHFDGIDWTIVPSPNVGTRFNHLGAMAALSSDDIWAVGSWSDENLVNMPMIQHWDGSAWSVVETPIVAGSSAFLYGVSAASATDVWAVGYLNVATALQLTLTLHWNGIEWSTVDSPSPSVDSDVLWSVSTLATDDVWAVGSSQADGDYDPLIQHWDGSAWSVVPSPDPDESTISFLWGVETVSADDVWALGRTYDAGDYPSLVERWDGAAWNVVSHPNERLYNEMYDAAAVSPDDVWAVGRHGEGFFNNIAVITHWDGSAWSVVANPAPDPEGESYLYAVVAAAPDDVWAVGAHLDGFTYKTLITRYNPAPVGVPAAISPPIAMSSAPNPARSHASLHFSVPAAGDVTIGLFDQAGRRVRSVVSRARLAAGDHEVTVSTGGVPSGVYFVRLETPSHVSSHKMIIAR